MSVTEREDTTVADQVHALRAVRLGMQRIYLEADRLAGSPGRQPALADVLAKALIAGHTATRIHRRHDRELVPAASAVRKRTLEQLRRLRAAETELTGRPSPDWLDDPNEVEN